MHRIKPAYLTILVLALALLLVACGPAATPEVEVQATEPPATEPPPTDTPVPEPTETPSPEPTEAPSEDEVMAQELWDEIQTANYQEEWSTVPGKETLYRGQAPHGALLSTYLNAAAAEALESQPGEFPEDTIIVKDNHLEDESLESVTVMYKEAGYDPNHNDWYWAKYGADGTIQAAGKPAGCISCHGSVRSNDYVFTFPIAPIETAAVEPTDEIMAMAEELWQELQDAEYQDNWTTVPGKGTLYRGQHPHGMLLSTYLNTAAAEAMESQPGTMPSDAIIVKENHLQDESLDSVTVMYKEDGFDPDHNDWYWAKYGADGTVQAAGMPVGCLSCHGAVRSNDYIFTFPIAPISPEGAPPEVEMPPAGEAMGEAEEEEMEEEEEMGEEGMAELPPAPSQEEAVALINDGGCGGCHVIPGVEGANGTVGPNWCEPAGDVQAGERGVSFLAESIVDPNAVVEEGYPADVMPKNFGDQFTEEEIDTLVAFIANLECEE